MTPVGSFVPREGHRQADPRDWLSGQFSWVNELQVWREALSQPIFTCVIYVYAHICVETPRTNMNAGTHEHTYVSNTEKNTSFRLAMLIVQIVLMYSQMASLFINILQ